MLELSLSLIIVIILLLVSFQSMVSIVYYMKFIIIYGYTLSFTGIMDSSDNEQQLPIERGEKIMFNNDNSSFNSQKYC